MVNEKVKSSVHNLTENDRRHEAQHDAIRKRSASGQEVVAFDGRAMTINCCFNLRGDVLDKHDKVVSTLTLTNVSYVPGSKFNLFSTSQAIKQGWIGQIDKNSARLNRGKEVLTFDRLSPTGTSMLYALRLVPKGTRERCNLLMEDPEKNEDTARIRIENSISRNCDPVKKVTSAKTKISKQQAR